MSDINASLSDVFKLTPMGDVKNAIGTTFYGINHRQTPRPVPINKDGYGLVFFTRPQLNLTKENIRADRRFVPLLKTDKTSIQRIIRTTLDPRLNYTDPAGNDCPFVDHEGAFIPLLTNHCLTLTGWPDPEVETFTSKPGAYKEVYGYTDGTAEIYGAYDITATFRNMIGDPVTAMAWHWYLYKALVFDGTFMPYPDFMFRKEIDYNTRIYRLVLDPTRRYVQKIACTGAAEIVTSNMGAAYNFDVDKPFNATAENVDVRIRCYGAMYQDPIIATMFNRTVAIFNPPMGSATDQYGRPVPDTRWMIPIPFDQLSIFNDCRCYPYIHPDTYELQWWMFRNEYALINTLYEQTVGVINEAFDTRRFTGVAP